MPDSSLEGVNDTTQLTADDELDEVEAVGLNDFRISKEDLVEFMKNRQADMVEAIKERFTDINGLIRALKSSAVKGLPNLQQDLDGRTQKFGVNFIPPTPPKSFLMLCWEALEDTVLRILIVAAILSLILGMVIESVETGWIEGFAILVAVAVVSLVTALNDWQKEKQFRQLKGQISKEQVVNVIRGGNTQTLHIKEIVVGDVVQLKYGDLIPADGILLQGSDLMVDESSLTGESDMVKKSIEKDPALLSGTHIMEGSCKYLITAVGPNSQSGTIMLLLSGKHGKNADSATREGSAMENVDLPDSASSKEDEPEEENGEGKEKSILQNKLTKLALTIGWCGVVAAVATTFVIILRFCIETYAIKKEPWKRGHLLAFLKAFIVGITILVVAIPEGLPLAVTISLAYSVKKMLKDNNLVRHLNACETMGNATAICSDKTGTLTTNRMTVVESYIQGKHNKTVPAGGSLTQEFVDLFCESIAVNSNYGSRIEVRIDRLYLFIFQPL